MRVMSLEQIEKAIKSNKKSANLQIRALANQENKRRKRFRPRSKGEMEALTQISISRWNKAVSDGKIKFLDDRVLYYDYN